MAGVLDAMHEVAPGAAARLTWASAGSSRSTSATAAPRSPWSRSRARCSARRCARCRVHVGLDGAATQDAAEWWVAAARGGARGDRRGAASTASALHAVAITGQWASTVPGRRRRRARRRRCCSGPTPARATLVREVIGGPVSVSGFAPHKVLPFVRTTGGAPTPERRRPHRPLAAAAAQRLREVYDRDRGAARAGRLPRPAVHRPRRRDAGVDDRVAGSPTTARARRSATSTPSSRARAATARGCPSSSPPARCSAALLPEVAAELGVAPGAPVVCGDPRPARGRRRARARCAPYETHVAISTTSWIGARVPFKRTDILHSIATVPGLDPAHPLVANNQETGGAALQWLREQIIAPHDGLLGGGSGIGRERHGGRGAARPSFEDLLRARGDARPRAARACCSCRGSTASAARSRTSTCARGWLNISLRTDRAMLVRSVLEGVAYNARWLFDAYEKFLKRPVPDGAHPRRRRAERPVVPDPRRRARRARSSRSADPRHAQLRGVALWARICLGELTLDEVPALVPVAQRVRAVGARPAYADGLRRVPQARRQAQGPLPPAELGVRDVLMTAESPDSGEARRPAGA